jgi:6-phosphofructokinase 1
MTKRRRRIAILTGGGDCPGLNAVIRAVVKAAQNVHGWETYGVFDGFEGFLAPKGDGIRRIDRGDIAGILPRGGTILGASNRCNLFAVPRRKGPPKDESPRVGRTLARMGISGLVVVGGEGTQTAAARLTAMGVPVVSVPKTIDNDLGGTDVTFGHDSAVSVVADAIDRLHSTAESHSRVLCVEVMGRHTGWIALHGGIAGGADVILIPEIPYDPDRVASRVTRRARLGRRFSIVVVSEGARRFHTGPVYRHGKGKDPITDRLGGVVEVVREEILARAQTEVRSIVLGHLQRGGSPTPFDRVLATRFGVKAVQMLADHEYGRMTALRGTEVVSVDVADAVRALKRVDPGGSLVRTARDLGVSFAAADAADDVHTRARTRHGAP